MNCGKRYFGMILLIALMLLVAFSAAGCTETNADNITEVRVPAELAQAYNNALTSTLNKAANEVQDADLSRFTKNLIASYPLGGAVSESQTPESLLPDVKGITKIASDSALREAGKNLKDKELKEFYDSFIKSIGVGK
jgi:hypothetical protein